MFVFVLMLVAILCIVVAIFALYVQYRELQKLTKECTESEEQDTYDNYVLTEDDENKIVAYALKQLKYNQNELHISEYRDDIDRCSQRNWRFYAFLEDLSIIFDIEEVIRWKSDSELSLLRSCADEFLKGGDCNPFTGIKIELRTFDAEDKIEVLDWPTIEKFVDILYDTYYKMKFHQFVSLRRKEKERMKKFAKQRKVEIYKKIGIDKK